MNRRMLSIIVSCVLLSMVSLMAGCRGGGSGDTGQAPVTTGDQPAFNVSGAKQLVALSSTVAPTTSSSHAKGLFSSLLGQKQLFEYQIVNQGLSNEEILARAKGSSGVIRAAATPPLSGTNLLAIDENGNASLAINANYVIKVMYSVTDPAGENVYLALDPGFVNPDGNDYSQFIAQNNCAFYRVKIADNSYACVQEGVYVQSIDSSYMSMVSGNQKPVQFDADGNIYYAATKFVRTCDASGDCTMTNAVWNPRIYRIVKADGNVMPLTQDNQRISYFLVLSTGEIAYISSTTGAGTALYLWQKSTADMNPNGTTIDLTGPSSPTFFTVDNFNTIIWGPYYQNSTGIRFGRPAASGVDKATYSTKIFTRAGTSTTPSRIIVGDDGKLYAIFSDYRTDYDPITQKSSSTSLFRVFQVLPSNPVPKLEIALSKTINQNLLASSTPFQVAHGFLFYKDVTEKLGYGTVDVIRMVNLADRTVITLLGGQNDWYEIYSWRLKGDKLFFAALDLSKTIVVSGEIDVAVVQENPLRPPSDYLTVNQSASAIGATSRVQDIEALVAMPVQSTEGTPSVKNIYASTDNLYSASVEFNKYMDRKSVESNIQLIDTDHGTVISSMKVWIQKILHLIPDLDNNGTTLPNDPLLDLASSKPLAFKTNYQIIVEGGAQDTSNPPVSLSTPTALAFQTRPEFGWYISADNVGKYAGIRTKDDKGNALSSVPSFESWDLNVDDSTANKVPQNFRIQFRAKNLSSDGVGVTLYNLASSLVFTYFYSGQTLTYIDTSTSDRKIFDVKMQSGYVNMIFDSVYQNNLECCNYLNVNSQYAGTSSNVPSLYNGVMNSYRLDLYGNTLALYYSIDGIAFTGIPLQRYDYSVGAYIPVSNIADIVSRPNGPYKLLIRVSQPVDIDNIVLTPLDSTGVPSGSAIMNVDFQTIVPPIASTDPAPGANVPDLRTGMSSTLSGLN